MATVNIEKKITAWKLSVSPTFKDNHAIKRPQDLVCHIHQVKVKGESWTILIGLLNNRPYEMFGGLSKFVEIPKKYKLGTLTKNGKVDGISTYNLAIGEGDDKMVIKDIVNVFDNPNYGSFTRMISLSLRHGTPVQYVVEQLQKDKYSDITSFSKVMARVLKEYIQDGLTAAAGTSCPNCKAENTLVYQEGCLTCRDCGYSKCG